MDENNSTKKYPSNEQPSQNKNKATVDVYRDLLRVEVRALVSRVGELTQTVGDLFTEVSHIAIQLESSTSSVEQSTAGINYCRSQLGDLKQTTAKWETQLEALQKRIQDTEDRMESLEVQMDTNLYLQGGQE